MEERKSQAETLENKFAKMRESLKCEILKKKDVLQNEIRELNR
jgi:hypothetical protein